jgi:hypothetical protein
MMNNQLHELALNWRTTGAPISSKVRRFAPVRQLRQLLYNWQLERRREPRPRTTLKSRLQTKRRTKKNCRRAAAPAGRRVFAFRPGIIRIEYFAENRARLDGAGRRAQI